METTLCLVRHAHAVWQPDERQHLSERGRAEAEHVAEVLAPLSITAICASPYPRAVETVKPLARRLELPVRIEADLRERRLSPGRVDDFERAVRWAWDHDDEALPGGEPNRVARERVLGVVERLRAEHVGGHVVVCTHGSLMALLINHFDSRFTFERWEQMTMPDLYRIDPNGDVTRTWEG